MVEVESKIKLMPYGTNYNGKHNGWAFQLLNDNYEGFHLSVCCKDFLQDIVWSELTQKSMQIHGQKSGYKGIIDKQTNLKLVMYPHKFAGVENPKIDNLEDLSSNLQGFLNEIELLMNVEELSVVQAINNNVLIEFSKKWIDKPYLFSMFLLLCRLGVYYNGKLEEYLKNPFIGDTPYLDNCDMYSLKDHWKKLLDIIEGKAVIEGKDWKYLITPDEVHHASGLFDSIHLLKYKENGIDIDQTKKES